MFVGKKLKVKIVPDKYAYKSTKIKTFRLFKYFEKVSKKEPLLLALFNATFSVINKIDYELIKQGNVKDEIAFSYDGEAYLSTFELIKKLNEEIYEIRLDNRFEKKQNEDASIHYRFFFFCENGSNWGEENKNVVFCCMYDYQLKYTKNKNSKNQLIKKSANIITNTKIRDGEFLMEHFTRNPEQFSIYLK